MSHTTEGELVKAIADWVALHAVSGGQSLAVTPETDLIAAGLVDSLGVVDLLLHLEGLSGARVDLTNADPAEFGTVRSLCRLVLGDRTHLG